MDRDRRGGSEWAQQTGEELRASRSRSSRGRKRGEKRRASEVSPLPRRGGYDGENSVECPMAPIRRRTKNAGETRGQGSLSRWPVLGAVPAGRGSAAAGRQWLFLAPRLALVHSACTSSSERAAPARLYQRPSIALGSVRAFNAGAAWPSSVERTNSRCICRAPAREGRTAQDRRVPRALAGEEPRS